MSADHGYVVEVNQLRVELAESRHDVVDEITLRVRPSEVVGLVGESGCGKTTVGLALLGHCRGGASIATGAVLIDGRDLAELAPAGLDRVRGRTVAYIPQDPPSALNPALRIGAQLREMLIEHAPDLNREQREARLIETLQEVSLPSDEGFLRRFPHELSGGQQQRVVIAMAFACRPKVIVCDEPTTGLDVATQARVLDTILALSRSHQTAVIYVSHDLAVVSAIASRVAVMYAGRIVELAPSDVLFSNPRHPYTRRLLLAVPERDTTRTPVGIPGNAPPPGSRPSGCFFAPRCPLRVDRCSEAFPAAEDFSVGHLVRCYRAGDDVPVAQIPATTSRQSLGEVVLAAQVTQAAYSRQVVLEGVELEVRERECVALVGESGSGKTTIARCISGLHAEYAGEIQLGGSVLAPGARQRSTEQRRRIQYVFQNPYASLNPRQTVGQSIATPLRLFFDVTGAAARARIEELLGLVSMPAATAGRYPAQLSGGERQRVAIARALAAEPALLVCDEVTSALDVSVQAAIVSLLRRLQDETGTSLLFITHNLPLIRTIADRVLVMSAGRIVEQGPTEQLFVAPEAQYTRDLLAHTPTIRALSPT